MRVFRQNKLWRDKLIEMMEQNYGSRIHWRLLNDAEFDKEIRIKLKEEAEEVAAANNHKALVEEFADLYEVIDTLSALHGITKDEIIETQTKKRDKRGGFISRRFVEVAEHPIGSFGEKYCLANPEKYPEII